MRFDEEGKIAIVIATIIIIGIITKTIIEVKCQTWL